ncbi:MAG: SRPBCC domain-containing protein [Pseudomonadota bacterium]
MSDILGAVADVARDVEASEDGACTVVLRRPYDFPVEAVWRACTTPAHLEAWFLPISGTLAPGGRYQFEGNAGGEILNCEAPQCLRVSWLYADHPDQEVSLHLAPQASGSVFELRHWTPRATSALELPFAVGPGWDSSLVALGAYLGGQLPERSWWESPGGVALIERSARAWQRVLVARELASPDAAERAADQAIAFYTGIEAAQATT